MHNKKNFQRVKQSLSEVVCTVVFNTGQRTVMVHSEYVGTPKSQTNLMLLISVLLPCPS